MQYEICDVAKAQNIGNVLFNFLVDIDNGGKNNNNDPITTFSATANDDIGTNEKTKLDLSTKASSLKPQREMHTILSSSNNKSSASRSSMYDASGKLIKQWANVKGASNNTTTNVYEKSHEDDDDDEVLKKQLERNRNEYIKHVSEG